MRWLPTSKGIWPMKILCWYAAGSTTPRPSLMLPRLAGRLPPGLPPPPPLLWACAAAIIIAAAALFIM